jgi:hypothetical protein
MGDDGPDRNVPLPLAAERTLDEVCLRFEAAWKADGRPAIEDYLRDVPEAVRGPLLEELLRLDCVYRRRCGEIPVSADYLVRFADHRSVIERVLDETVPPMDDLATPPPGARPAPSGPAGGARVEVPGYEILELLGQGGMGTVFKAQQLSAKRTVALKLIRTDRLEELGPTP